MTAVQHPQPVHVAGRVKGPVDNRDKSYSFWVAGQKFVVAKKSGYAAVLASARRALVRYVVETGKSSEVLKRNPKILLVLAEPTARLIRQYNSEQGA